MTLVRGQFLKPDGSPIAGVTVKAYLAETAGESKGPEIYASSAAVNATSDSSGLWSMSLWANSNGVLPTKYVFIIKYSNTSNEIKYELSVPNETEVFFSDLMVNYSNAARNAELFNTEAAEYNLTITQGNSVRRKFEIVDTSNQPTDLTGWQARLMLKDTKSSWSLVVNPIIEALEGSINLRLTGAQTNAFGGDKNIVYELTIFNSEDVIKLLYGKVTVTPSFLIINGGS